MKLRDLDGPQSLVHVWFKCEEDMAACQCTQGRKMT